MRQRGFSLVELLTVMAIAGILLAVAGMSWGRMQRNAAIEAQVRKLQADLLELRQQALYSKSPRTVSLTGRSFKVYHAANDSGTPQLIKELRYPVAWSSSGILTFDTQGLAGLGGATRTLCVTPTGSLSQLNSASVDSLVIYDAKINVGIRTGGTCDSDNIDQK